MILLACSVCYGVHLRVQRDHFYNEAKAANLAAMRIAATAMEQTP